VNALAAHLPEIPTFFPRPQSMQRHFHVYAQHLSHPMEIGFMKKKTEEHPA
jgi:hypothetical protein